ncbi:uncharacterized protein METZ01_LOCUS469984 [marine metagenome]|uniref:Uncharacterized protein n=1 Tax=marine metagenome TaxID=408172 RepID=A0A383BBH0_9ZZZZ
MAQYLRNLFYKHALVFVSKKRNVIV